MSNENNKSKYGELPKVGSKDIQRIISFFRDCGIRLSEDEILLKEINSRQNDLLHDIEIPEKLTRLQMRDLGEELRETRRTRRIVKDEMMVLDPICAFLKANPNLLSSLETLTGSVMSAESFLKNRSYKIKSQIIAPAPKKDPENKEKNPIVIPEVQTPAANIILTEDDRIMMVINTILSKWSSQYETNAYKTGEDCILSGPCLTYSFKLTKDKYDYSAAKSTLMNFRELFEKSTQSLYKENILVELEISDIPIQVKSAYNLTAKYSVYIDDSLKYILEGSIIYRQKHSNKPLRQKKHK